MKKTLTGAAVAALAATAAQAGGLDRSGQSVAAIFEEDGTTALSYGIVVPSISGEDIGGTGSYDVGETYTQPGLSYTNAVGGGFNYALIFDKPYGANVTYDDDPTTSNLGGTFADLNSQALTLVGRYKLNQNLSVFAGLGVQSIDAQVGLNGRSYAGAIATSAVASGVPGLDSEVLGRALHGDTAAQTFLDTNFGFAGGYLGLASAVNTQSTNFLANGGYSFDMEDSKRPTYLVGAAYEIPAIAMRIAGTYRFETEHTADTSESLFGASVDGEVDYVTPQSFNLEAQTGIAEGTLLTLSWRWTEFSAVDIVPDALGSDLVNLEDSNRYTLGIGRRFSERLAGSATLSYEPENGRDTVSPLGPTDGLIGVSLGARFDEGPMSISGGVNYSWLGDADAGVADQPVAEFKDNHAVGIGVKATFTF